MRRMPARLGASKGAACRQASVVAAGRSASATSRSREVGNVAVQSATCPRGTPRWRSSRARLNCGWLSSVSICCQVASSLRPSRPGSTTMPCGRPATTSSRSRVAGILPVVPAAITGKPGGLARQSAPCASSSRLRRSAGSSAPYSSSSLGQASVTMRRKSSVICQCCAYSAGTSPASLSKDSRSVCTWSSSRASSAASLIAWSGRRGPSSSRSPSFRIRRESSNCR